MKSALRLDFAKKISSLSSNDKKNLSFEIQRNLKKALDSKNGTWVAYCNLSDEPEINWAVLSEKIQWAFPKLDGESLSFVKNPEKFIKSKLGFSEPVMGESTDIKNIQGFVMPGLAFDQYGCRLGRGRAYYDRALNDYRGEKIGVCFGVSFCEKLPCENHDVKCDQIITDKKIYLVKNS